MTVNKVIHIWHICGNGNDIRSCMKTTPSWVSEYHVVDPKSLFVNSRMEAIALPFVEASTAASFVQQADGGDSIVSGRGLSGGSQFSPLRFTN